MSEEEIEDQVDPTDTPIQWGTKETNGLSQRMALRIATMMKRCKGKKMNQGKRRSVKDVVTVGLGVYNYDRPAWFPSLNTETWYDDDWDDWTDNEVRTLKARLKAGADLEMLSWVFSLPERMSAALDADMEEVRIPATNPAKVEKEKPKATDEDESEQTIEPAKYDTGAFTNRDITNTDDRRFGNRRWTEYSVSVDLDKPANQMTMKLMITLEIQFRHAQSRLNSKEKKVRQAAAKEVITIRDAYSKCAQDVALLEKQYKLEPEKESLDSIILRTHEIRQDWRNMEIENEMGVRGIFDQLELFHRTHLDEDGNRAEIEIPEVKPSTSKGSVPYNHEATLIEQSDKGHEMVIEG